MKIVPKLDDIKSLNFEEISENFDLYYSILVNKVICYCYGDENDIKSAKEKMKQIFILSKDKLKFNDEGKMLYDYLLVDKLLENEIKKISQNQNEFEILLYSLRFVFNTQIMGEKCFYNDLIMKGAFQYIQNNYIPGSFPLMNEYLKSYNILREKLKQKLYMGYYICKDCGFLHEVKPCTFPMAKSICPNGHVIGGIDHILAKKDLRVFYENSDYDNLYKKWKKAKNSKTWFNSFEKINLKEFKTNYLIKILL